MSIEHTYQLSVEVWGFCIQRDLHDLRPFYYYGTQKISLKSFKWKICIKDLKHILNSK